MNLRPFSTEQDEYIVSAVRARSGVLDASVGPSDELIVAGVRGYVREFNYWYERVLDNAVRKYQKLIIDRINPMIRSMQLVGLSADAVAERLLADWSQRNYVTAGGWALEQLAIAASPRLRKSAASGIDAEWHALGDPLVVNLYVIKSGTVTRNSDILKALKSHGREAHKRLLQTDKSAVVRIQYVVLAGQKSTTFHDGVHRPSSAAFWSEALAIADEKKAIDLALAMAQEAAKLVNSEASSDALRAMSIAVSNYISKTDGTGGVDWEFLAQRNMIADAEVKKDARRRHRLAVERLESAGYHWSEFP